MSSLSVHLRLAEDHSRLPFHPMCPVCRRDRLAGSLADDELLSRRTQAAIAAGMLAFSGIGAPAAAVASGPDEYFEGTTEVVEGSEPGTVDLGPTTPLGDAEAELPDDADVPLPEPEEVVPEPAPVERAPEAAEVVVEPVVEAAPAPEPVAIIAPPAEVPETTETTEAPEPEVVGGPRVDQTKPERRAVRVTKSVERRVVVAPAPAPAPETDEAPAPATVQVVAGTSAVASSEEASEGDRFHVVQRGESLWSIAADVLGERAGVARIAREVNRLWALNEDRIASGSPDLLYAGTRLRLR